MKKLLLSILVVLSVGCASKPVVTTMDCKTDCYTEIANMKAYTGKFSGYVITSNHSDSFSASHSEQENYNYRSGMVSNAYYNVWINGKKLNVQAMNNGVDDVDMIVNLSKVKDYDWQSEQVHKVQSVVIDERRLMVEQMFQNF